MDDLLVKAIEAKNSLIENMNTVVMSTIGSDGLPNSSYAPAIVDLDYNFYIYISSLSKHTSNLLSNNKVSIMIIEDESVSENIFGRKRFTMDAHSDLIDRESNKWNQLILNMESKFGETVTYLKNMTDFHLFKIKPQKGLLVHGFARAFVFDGPGLSQIRYLNEKGHTKK
ncbi:MAG: HugZ family protein [Pelagibacteraceae bacterium TMED124]|nr:pyridoxamine 5-phosphate oxidase [Candidatus Neomarinimicrobiota bacterium]RPG19123.1 MAG: HugZ family protein [Pelagibacteraceae bacterium TMED124]|tara:strand:+ start:22878 stop:23387 length:510 start_codon:yes stop_codon:yes gene_type:complete